MEFENKKLRDVAEIARQIMMGEKVLHPNQQKLDVHEPEKDELTADDFKKLRAGKKAEVKKEEVEQIDELKKSTLGSYIRKAATDAVDRTAQEIETGEMDKLADKRMKGIKTATKKLSKEEVEELDEVKMADLPSRKVQGRAYGAYKPEPHAVDTLAGPKTKELKAIEAEKPIKKDPKNYVKDTGQKRNYKVHAGRYFSNLDTGVSSKGLEEPRYKNESFANILASYSEGGLKGLFETLNQNKVIVEEPDSEQFAQEVKTAQDKSEGKGKKAEVAAAGVKAVKQEGVEVVEYPLDANEINGYSEVTIGKSIELTEDEAEMLASLSQEEFNYLTEEEQDLFIEYFQPLDEISTGAAKNYLKKAVSSSSKLNQKAAKPGDAAARASNYSHENDTYETKEFQKFSKRRTGIRKAITKLASAHPDNKKLATTARQAFNKLHNTNYRIGMGKGTEDPSDRKFVKQQHAVMHKAVNAMKEESVKPSKDFDARNKEILDAKSKYRGEMIAQKAASKMKSTEKQKNEEVEPTQLMSFKARYKK